MRKNKMRRQLGEPAADVSEVKQSTISCLMVGIPAKDSDLRHVLGLAMEDPVVVLEGRGRLQGAASDLDIGRVREALPGAMVYNTEELGLRGRNGRKPAAWALALLKRNGLRTVGVADSFPLGVARLLERGGIRLRLVGPSVRPSRAVKTAAEVAAIAGCQKAAVAAMREAGRMIGGAREGRGRELFWEGRVLTSERVRGVMQGVLLARGMVCPELIVAGGPSSADPHEKGFGPLRGGEPIVIDVFPRDLATGYWGDLTRTLVKGRYGGRLREMLGAVAEAHAGALEMVAAGVDAAAIHEEARVRMERRGFETRVAGGERRGFIHGTGHGVGLDVHEAPRVAPGGGTLCEGHVVTIEPGLYYPEIGGVRIEDTVAVTQRGYRRLAALRPRLCLQ